MGQEEKKKKKEVESQNLFRLKAERHETRHVGPLCAPECSRPNGFLNFDVKV